MACFSEEEKQLFPITNIDKLVEFIISHLKNRDEPNLALLSIILGCVENSLTCNRKLISDENEKFGKLKTNHLPPLQLSKVEALYQRFVSFVKSSIDSTAESGPYTSRESVKRISDVIWSGLTSNYTDKAHLQSLYSYLTGYKLDCFGVALGVVAACQILGYKDVHLCLSEDHAWVVFGEGGRETAEVTWHGKGVEDRRGQPVGVGPAAGRSWLYLDGQAVVCTRHMELAAIVASINPAISAAADSVEMARLQQQLLWLLFDQGHLDRYPMSLGTLGDLEEIDPTPGRPHCEEIYKQGVNIARRCYGNQHVYPHTYMGAFYYRQGRYRLALKHWAEAAEVISHYNYSRDDEEIYKEFLEIAHDLIPQIVRLAADGYLVGSTHHKTAKIMEETAMGLKEVTPFLKDRENYELILRFYDGICSWEEGSSTPVLHITWAKHFIFSLSKFDGAMREQIQVVREPGDESSSPAESEADSDSDSEVDRDDEKENRNRKLPASRRCSGELINGSQEKKVKSESIKNQTIDESQPKLTERTETISKPLVANGDGSGDNNNDTAKQIDGDPIKTSADPGSNMAGTEDEATAEGPDSQNIADLAKACADSILNPDFLLGKGEPFTTSIPTTMFTTVSDKSDTVDLKSQVVRNGSKMMETEFTSSFSTPLSLPSLTTTPVNKHTSTRRESTSSLSPNYTRYAAPKLEFRSAKMKGLKGLLTSERLNTSAINLQMTAQSQVSLKHSKVHSTYDQGVPRKRTRRSEPM